MLFALVLLTLGGTLEMTAQKKEKKEKKAKKELKWEWDGTKSGNETIDNYLLTIDTLYNRVISYRDSIDAFQFKCETLEIGGKYYQMAWMLNPEGQLVTQGQVNYQCFKACGDGLNIVLDMTNAGLQSVNAALALPSLGLNALKFGKYVKGGPAVIAQGLTTVKTMRGTWISNLKTWRGLKNGALDEAQVRELGIFNDDAVKKITKCVYIKLIDPADPEYTDVETIMKSKTDEEKEAVAKAYADQIASVEMAKVDARSTMDTVNDEDFQKMVNEG